MNILGLPKICYRAQEKRSIISNTDSSSSAFIQVCASGCLKLPQVALSCLHFPAAIIDCRCLWIQPGCKHLHSCSSDQLEVNHWLFSTSLSAEQTGNAGKKSATFNPAWVQTALVRQHRAQAHARVQKLYIAVLWLSRSSTTYQ